MASNNVAHLHGTPIDVEIRNKAGELLAKSLAITDLIACADPAQLDDNTLGNAAWCLREMLTEARTLVE